MAVYPEPEFNPFRGFDVQGGMQRRRWTLNGGECARTGIALKNEMENTDESLKH